MEFLCRLFVWKGRRRWRFLILLFSVLIGLQLILMHLFDASILSFYDFITQPNSHIHEDFNKYFLNKQLKRSFLERKGNIYDLRKTDIRLACEKMKRGNPILYRSIQMPESPEKTLRLGISVEYELLWAKVAKVGTSSWRHNFKILRNFSSNHSEEVSKFREATKGRESLLNYWNIKRRQGFVAFFFTRHPFERIVSAYKGKLENKSRSSVSQSYHERIGTYIVDTYRSNLTREFIHQEECTWLEFVHFLLEDNSTDHHWRPMVNLVYPCDLVYDVYGRLRSFDEDSWYIILKKRLEHLITARWDNKGYFGSATRSYIERLPAYLIEALYDKYRADFELFGYDIKGYKGYDLSNVKR